MSITNVALIGGTGTLGGPVLSALKTSPFTTWVLNRASSRSVYPGTRVITVPDNLEVHAVASELRALAIDALVITIAGSHVEDQKRLIDAAWLGGVKRVLPAEFGSCDSADPETNDVLPLMKGKKEVRDYLISITAKPRDNERGDMTWTSLVTGHFFDWGLTCGLLKFDVAARRAELLDGGDIYFSASNLGFIGRAVLRVLERADQTQNQILYVHSLRVTQRQVLAALEKVTGARFDKVEQSSKEELAKVRPKMLSGDHAAREEVVAIWGVVAADWSKRDGFANDLLGLEEEDLEETVRRVVADC